MTGLEAIRAMIARGKRPPMMELMGIDLASVEEGAVVFSATPGRAVYNPLGIVHGGFAATMLDSACGLAATSALPDGKDCVTLELKVAYHRAMTDATGLVHAEGAVLSMGRRAAHTEAKLIGEDGTLYASATSTLLIVDRSAPPAG